MSYLLVEPYCRCTRQQVTRSAAMVRAMAKWMVCNFSLDCPDPGALAGFYAKLLGLRLDGPVEDDWAVLCSTAEATPKLAFCGVQRYRPPQWPDPQRSYPQQAHLDVIVRDLDAAAQLVLDLGGTKLAQRDLITVCADPAGHPFCLSGDHWEVFDRASEMSLANADAMVCNYTLECSDPSALAEFYRALLGVRQVNPADADWVDLATGSILQDIRSVSTKGPVHHESVRSSSTARTTTHSLRSTPRCSMHS